MAVDPLVTCHTECIGESLCVAAASAAGREDYRPPFLLRVIARDYPLLEVLCYSPPAERGRLLEGMWTHLTENYGMQIPPWVWTALGENR